MKIIDISEHNGNIDFNKVKASGIEGIIIRLGWIGNKNNHTLDKRFLEYYHEANRLGFKIGFYVYSYCISLETLTQGAFWTLDQLIGKKCDLGCYLDLEDNSISNLGKQILTNQVLQFCMIMEENSIISGTYANLYWFNTKLNVSDIGRYKIWLAQYTSNNKHDASFPVNIWQYSSKGSINGINTPVDMNKIEKWDNLPGATETPSENNKGGFEVKIYQNGSTKEDVYEDKNCTKKIGYLNAYETAECYAIVDNKPVVVYNVDGTSNKKVGFVKWLRSVLKIKVPCGILKKEGIKMTKVVNSSKKYHKSPVFTEILRKIIKFLIGIITFPRHNFNFNYNCNCMDFGGIKMASVKSNKSPLHITCTVGQPYGTSSASYTCGFHTGADIPASGTAESNPDLYSCVEDGEVVYTYTESTGHEGNSLGNQVQIRDNKTGNYFRYCHMLYNSIVVSVGDKVTTATKLGKMGNTGNSTGTHLHLELSTSQSWQCANFLSPLPALRHSE